MRAVSRLESNIPWPRPGTNHIDREVGLLAFVVLWRFMHDYYTVIARAVSRLESNTPVTRKAVFDRARTILIDQLRIRRPPASDAEIIREREALENAIRKIELELATVNKSRTGPARAPPLGRTYNSRPLQPDQNAATSVLRGQEQFSKSDHRTRPIKAAASIKSYHAVVAGQQWAPALRGVFNQSRATLARSLRLTTTPSRLVTKNTKEQIDTTGRKHSYDVAPNIYKPRDGANEADSRPLTFAKGYGSPDNLATSGDIPLFNHLLGIQWLDQLMLDAALPEAPDSLKEDARTVLEWLGIDKLEAIKLEHYDRFTQAFQKYIMECQSSAVGLAPTTTRDSFFVLNDDLRGTFSRLLEREQAARVFDKALMWFAKVWICIVIVLNVIAVTGLLATAPSLWIGVVRLSEAYNPSNVRNLAAQLVALSPALVAMAWLHRRLKYPRIAALTAFAKSMAGSLVGKDVGSEAPL